MNVCNAAMSIVETFPVIVRVPVFCYSRVTQSTQFELPMARALIGLRWVC
jgi:hypothetical protein